LSLVGSTQFKVVGSNDLFDRPAQWLIVAAHWTLLKTIENLEVKKSVRSSGFSGLRCAAADRRANQVYGVHGRRTLQFNQVSAELSAKDAMLTELSRCRRVVGSSLE